MGEIVRLQKYIAMCGAASRRHAEEFITQGRVDVDGRTVTELPAGKLDSPEEDPLEAAKRELREETGAEAREWVPLGEFLPAVAYSTERLWLFAAKGLCFGRQDMDEDEFLEVFTAPLETLAEQALHGEIQDSKTQALLLRGYLLRQRGEL